MIVLTRFIKHGPWLLFVYEADILATEELSVCYLLVTIAT